MPQTKAAGGGGRRRAAAKATKATEAAGCGDRQSVDQTTAAEAAARLLPQNEGGGDRQSVDQTTAAAPRGHRMATCMVHYLKRPEFDTFLRTGDLPTSGSFAEEMPRSSIDGLTPYELNYIVVCGLVAHVMYSRRLRAWAGDESARGRTEVSVQSVQWMEDGRVIVVCSFD